MLAQSDLETGRWIGSVQPDRQADPGASRHEFGEQRKGCARRDDRDRSDDDETTEGMTDGSRVGLRRHRLVMAVCVPRRDHVMVLRSRGGLGERHHRTVGQAHEAKHHGKRGAQHGIGEPDRPHRIHVGWIQDLCQRRGQELASRSLDRMQRSRRRACQRGKKGPSSPLARISPRVQVGCGADPTAARILSISAFPRNGFSTMDTPARSARSRKIAFG